MVLVGCAAPPSIAPRILPVAVRYDVEPAMIGRTPEEAANRIERDFELIARMGFTEVLASFVAPSERMAVLELARKCNLRVTLTDPGFDHFVRSGVLPGDCPDAAALVARSLTPAVRGHLALAGVAIRAPRANQTADPLLALTRALRASRIAVSHLADSTAAPASDIELAVVSATLPPADSDESIRERWLANLNDALTLGRTAGLLFDRFRAPGGDGPMMIGDADPPTPGTLAALRDSVDRIRAWAPKLMGLDRRAEESSEAGGGRLTVFCGEKRRYVLVSNRSFDTYLREEVGFPARIDDRPVRRAVEVPPSPNPVPGEVFENRGGSLSVRVELRPRDAALFEIF
jgi:hypothetical protein